MCDTNFAADSCTYFLKTKEPDVCLFLKRNPIYATFFQDGRIRPQCPFKKGKLRFAGPFNLGIIE